MPGLATLQARASEIDISYHEVVAGARLLFVSNDAELIDALHGWGTCTDRRSWLARRSRGYLT
jgi:hypothetical protein